MTKSRIKSPCVWLAKADYRTFSFRGGTVRFTHASKQTRTLTTSKHNLKLHTIWPSLTFKTEQSFWIYTLWKKFLEIRWIFLIVGYLACLRSCSAVCWSVDNQAIWGSITSENLSMKNKKHMLLRKMIVSQLELGLPVATEFSKATSAKRTWPPRL